MNAECQKIDNNKCLGAPIGLKQTKQYKYSFTNSKFKVKFASTINVVPRPREGEVMSLCHNRRYLVIFGLQMSVSKQFRQKGKPNVKGPFKECIPRNV